MKAEKAAKAAAKKVDDILKGSKAGRATKGKTVQYVKSGNYTNAVKDFDSLKPSNVKSINTNFGKGKTGKLADGRTVTVRPGSSDGRPTVEIINPDGRKVEIRYGKQV